jgi:hypothetical protein
VRREPKFAQANRGTQQWVHLGEITNAQSGATDLTQIIKLGFYFEVQFSSF